MEAQLESPEIIPVPVLPGSAPAREEVDALNARAWELRSVDAPRAAELAEQALRLAEAEGYAAGAGLALRTLGTHRYHSGADYDGAMERFHRALELLDGAGEGPRLPWALAL